MNETLIFEYAFLCVLILVMGCSDLKMTSSLPFRLRLEGTVYFPHTPEISTEASHPADPRF